MNKLTPFNVNIVLYHGKCIDGFSSALALWKIHKDKITYTPCYYNMIPPNVFNKNVLVCDFSFSYEETKRMINQAKNFLIIDHHVSAKRNLEKIDDKYKILDLNHSGAWLTWKWAHNKIPKLIEYIQDRDIWTKKLEYTDQFFAKFKTIPFEFNEYNKLLNDNNLYKLIKDGISIYENDKHNMKNIIKKASCKLTEINGELYMIAYLNSNMYLSDLGNLLLSYIEICDFAVVYYYDNFNDITKFSLRSSDKKTDVSIIASLYGGGGHKNASGMILNGNHKYIKKPVHENNMNYIKIKRNKIKNFDVLYVNSYPNKKLVGKYFLQKYKCDIVVVYHNNTKTKKTHFLISHADKCLSTTKHLENYKTFNDMMSSTVYKMLKVI